ncbi:SWIM zinc finger family protein [Streptomyces sp. bgisy032]|uniref:SWIM zinc finger family protein n=1 Tax=Streptomyces sp. bgisy032 TaxID=3413773 RepID=UPI003D75EF0D
MTGNPADEVRRALREARERAARDPDATAAARPEQSPAPAARPGPAPAAGQAPTRPADVAREALRRAVSEQRGRGRGGEDTVADRSEGEGTGVSGDASTAVAGAGASGADPSGHAPGAGTPDPDAPADDIRTGQERDSSAEETPAPALAPEPAASGPRAADVAREALRAARKDARRAREEAEREGARRRRRARPGVVDERAAAARRARDGAGGERGREVSQLLSDAFRMPSLSEEDADTEAARDPDPSPPAAEDTAPTPRGLLPREVAPGGPEVTPRHAVAPGAGDVTFRHATARADDLTATWNATVRDPGGDRPTPPSPAAAAPTTQHAPRSPETPGPARSPRSMAAPGRDSDLRRTFPRFPPRKGETFAESWWGNAWVTALEQGALDVKRLERGRGYAGQGNVDAITVTPGLVLAYVQGSRPRPYRVQVRLRTLDDTDWDRFLDAAADRPGHIAALLDKEMPQSLADCGVPLLPGPGDLEPRCSCPDRGHPCKHAAALCYQTARLLDADPFVLLLLRGRGERELLDALSRLSATRAARAAQDREPAPLPGVRASEALAPRTLPPLPAPLPAPPHPEQPPAYPASPGGPDPFALDQLATDAAARAHALLTTGRDPVGQLSLWQDAVRLAAARPGSGLTAGARALYASLAAAAGRTPSELARAVAAWRQGGLEGLAVLEEPWDPPAGRFDRARPLLLAADLPAFRPWRNHLTHPRGHLQLRLGRDGLWYAYESEPGRDDWWPRGTPDLDPVGALTGLGVPGEP